MITLFIEQEYSDQALTAVLSVAQKNQRLVLPIRIRLTSSGFVSVVKPPRPPEPLMGQHQTNGSRRNEIDAPTRLARSLESPALAT